MRNLELLAPAKNLECGIAAINSGADAVYIGAKKFGARQAAGNSTDDIASLCRYAHKFGCKVYVTVNTIVYDNELHDTQRLLDELGAAGVDAILIQDMGLLKLSLPEGVALHASTQTDNRTAEKVSWLGSHGFERVVLARELTLDEIAQIHKGASETELEVFVHGALCVSYSGNCYASEYCFGRSANRGACAQFCRMKFDLLDDSGNIITGNAHVLSLKDMCRIDSLERLADAGVTSFKIEGRLKDINYVRNVTAAYSRKLNEIIKKRKGEYRRSGLGTADTSFTPNLKKTFNRGFTEYFLDGRKKDLASFYTPKAMGEYVGKVKEIRGNSFNVAGAASFANGDGLCFINSNNELEGFRINRAEGNRLFPPSMPRGLKSGTPLYRNSDQAFEKEMNNDKSVRKLTTDLLLSYTGNRLKLEAQVYGQEEKVSAERAVTLETAKSTQKENIRKQISKLGNTVFSAGEVILQPEDFPWFVPNSILAEMRRECTDKLENREARIAEEKASTKRTEQTNAVLPSYPFPYMYNIANKLAEKFYREEGLKNIQPAFELHKPATPLVMQCRYCLRYEIGQCKKRGGTAATIKDPLRIRLSDGRTFRLEFNCAQCIMNIYAET